MKKKGFYLSLVMGMILSVFIAGCDKKSDTTDMKDTTKQETNGNTTTSSDHSGSYVSDGYEKRSEGMDWVGVTVKKISDDEIKVSVRSRADKKKPTCTIDMNARKVKDDTYSAIVDGKTVLVTFGDKSVTISAEKKEDEDALYFYCSGGATFAGEYKMIDGQLDETQVDKTLFSKILRLQDIGFNVTSVNKDGKVELTILPFGLSVSNEPVMFSVDGEVVDAEIEDMDKDGSPEVLVYTRSGDNKGNVYGVSALAGKSLGLVSFPETSANEKINSGYNGEDEFTMVETTLSQRFPIYDNGKKTGKWRQVQYKLEPGETTKVLTVDKVTEIDK